MRVRSALVAVIGVATLVVAGCGASVAGTPVAAQAVAAGTGSSADSGSAAEGELPLPSDGDDGAGGSSSELGGPFGGFDAGELPDMGDLEDLFGGNGDVPDLGALLGGMTGEIPDLGALLEGFGEMGGTDLGGILGSECLQAASLSMSLGLALVKPSIGQPLTQAEADDLIDSLSQMPPELAGAAATLREALQQSVGASATDAQQLLGNRDIDDAMDAITDYMDSHCGGN